MPGIKDNLERTFVYRPALMFSKQAPYDQWLAHAMQICVKTNLAEYVAAKPAASFKKMFGHLMEQTDISFEVHCCPQFSMF